MTIFDRVMERPNNLPFRRFFWKHWYDHLASQYKTINISLMNYGYVNLDPNSQELELNSRDESERYCIQLYHHVASAVSLAEKTVLEVGCGRGGGASFVKRYLQPKVLTGVDFSKNNIGFCRQTHQLPGLNFEVGDAENLHFSENAFDAVINVESSHCYQKPEKFFGEVYRVLKPEGHFLFTDFRPKEDVAATRKQLENTGFIIVKEEDITANVCASMDLENQRKIKIINAQVHRIFHWFAKYFAAPQGTPVYRGLESRELQYLCYVLQKP